MPLLVSEPVPSVPPERVRPPVVEMAAVPEAVTRPERDAAVAEELARVPESAMASAPTVWALRSRVAPEATVVPEAVEPRAEALVNLRVPAETVTAPRVLEPPRTREPLPALVRPLAAERVELKVVVRPELTVIVLAVASAPPRVTWVPPVTVYASAEKVSPALVETVPETVTVPPVPAKRRAPEVAWDAVPWVPEVSDQTDDEEDQVPEPPPLAPGAQ